MVLSSSGNAATGRRVIYWTIATIVAALLATAIGLWARYGSAIFFDAIASGIASCF